MNRNISTKCAINHNIASLHSELQASNDYEINNENCYQKADNFLAQQSNDYVYAQLVHDDVDNDNVQVLNQNNEDEDYLQAINRFGNDDNDYLQAIDQLDNEDREYLIT